MRDRTLREIVAGIDRRIEGLFEEAPPGVRGDIFTPPSRSPVVDQVRDLALRSGKRLRPALLVCGAALFEESALGDPGVVDAAAALELMHVYFLIHDDIMDEDEVRRGGPSAHAALAAATGDRKLGRDLAILCGDMAMALHGELIAGMAAPEDRYRLAASLFARMHRDVIHGQELDLIQSANPEEIALRKTASYTTVGPLAIGGALGGAGGDSLDILAGIGVPLGVAFQLRDDVLGVFGDTAVTGKPVGTDLERGKRTYLIGEAVARADAGQREILDRVLGNARASDDDRVAARGILVDTGALEACEDRIAQLLEEAVSRIDEGGFLPEGRRLLLEMADILVARRT